MKTKSIRFDLSETMLLKDMVEYGYQRNEIIKLFEELESLQYGEFFRGSKGRGNPTKFICNNKAPTSYMLNVDVKKLHLNYAGLPPAENRQKLSRNTIAIASGLYKYQLTIKDNKLYLERDAVGEETIDQALKKIWEAIKDNVVEKETKQMNSFDIVISKLKGSGQYELTK
jgi:hypothetical protein